MGPLQRICEAARRPRLSMGSQPTAPGRGDASRAAAGAAFTALLALFALSAVEAVSALALGAETEALRDLRAAWPRTLDSTMQLASDVGRGRPLGVVAAVMAVALTLRRRPRDAALLVLAMAGAALNPPLKALFDRPRPQLGPTGAAFQGSSFPSGHAMSTASFVAAVVVLAWPTRWRLPSVVAGAVLLGAVGVSRLVLGAHYPSDVVGGWSFAFAWVAGLLLAERVVAPRSVRHTR